MTGRRRACGAVALVATLVACRPAEAAPELLTLDTRPGVTMKVLLMNPDVSPKGILVLFPGGDGRGHFGERDGRIWLGGNFLVRSGSLFVEEGFGIAIVDVPSDRAAGMSDEFRTSREHAADVQKLVDLVGRKWSGPVFVVGTSRGTISATHVGLSLQDPRLAGVVLTASIGQGRGRQFSRSVSELPLDALTLPVLFVHHREDGCWASRFDDAVRLWRRAGRSPRNGFVEVVGGDPARSGPCEPLSAHGFLGREKDVVKAIADWATGKPVPGRIGTP